LIPLGGWRERLVKKLFSVISFPGRIRRYYRLGENLAIIRKSELFDASWYLEQNPDVAQARVDPVRHYLLYGGFEGRDPSPHFSSKGYLGRYQDVQGAGGNPLVHYLLYGNDEGRLPYPIQTAVPSTVEAFHSPTRMKKKPSLMLSNNDETQAIHSYETGQNLSSTPETTAKMVVEDKNWKDYLLVSTEIKNKEQERSATITPRNPRLIACDGKDLLKATKSIYLPSSRNVQVSIIIPVYNNAKLLLECLLSLAKDQTFTEYDVCIVDDNSDTETRNIIDNLSGIRVVRNAERMGFTLSCNKGAQDASGNFLLFLNDDVQVFRGFLKFLLGTFEENSRVGAVGPKVIYPNGRLQEAGCIINRDGTTELIGHWDDPNLDRYNYQRDVDYISGVCMLVRKDDFLEVGGFDPRFAPAYYEDVDLCCKLREKGMRIIYNPDAIIVHHLSATTSNFFGLEKKVELVTRNRQKLIERWQPLLDEMNRVRLIAFYLPQFHPIPENDLWWGKGFTEWRKVTQARPLFDGHYQPHLPADLGFYDLRIPEIMEQQEELARRYGIEGFCYYYYWFNGKRLLETPLERMLKNGHSDFPFCLCWANENWTRRWDGGEKDILIAQHHSEEDDLAVIRDLIRYFKHPNYVRVNGKPLLLIYRVNIFPDFRRTAQIWREECRREGIGEIYLVMAETFELSLKNYAPEEFGLDAAVEFPPHGSWGRVSVPKLSPNFTGDIVNYKSEALIYSLKSFPKHIRYKTVMPSWDNSARRQNSATIFINSSPGAYQAWLEFAIRKTREQYSGDHRIVFVSAWNEWAEGNHLEPDQRYGHQYLEATANAIDYDLLNSTQDKETKTN
jgi:GT2 family glycosyltransferase